MKFNRKGRMALAVTASLFAAATSQAATVYTLGGNGSTLVKFDSSAPGATTVIGPISGAVNGLQGIDFRPANGLLYGFGTGGEIVTVNLTNAATNLVSTSTANSTSGNMGIDFNPVPDRLRLVNDLEQNLRINVDTGAAIVDGTLAYAAGDPNFGANPNIVEAAYTNSDTNLATGTTLYYIDYTLDTLVSTTNPNGGTLTTIGSLGVNTNEFVGFDILSDGMGGNIAYALLTDPINGASFYTSDTFTQQVTLRLVHAQTGGFITEISSNFSMPIEICALLTKPERREIEVPVKFVGFEIPNKFVIGYGLDFAERYRNLPYVAVLHPDLIPPH